MSPTTLLAILLELQTPPPDPPVPKPFAPVRAEVSAVDQGIEILTYDDQGELVGVLVATPDSDQIRIEADFADGYATIQLSPDEPGENAMQTDLEQTAAVGRVAEMFTLAVPPSEPLEASRARCMWTFAGIAALCGSAALLPPASVPIVASCLFGLGGALCECAEYLPIEVC
jgi:hypothetical protein